MIRALPLKSARILVIEPDHIRSNKLERELKSLGASVLVASTVALAKTKITNVDVVMIPQDSASEMICVQPKVVTVDNDKKGLESLLSGISDWYVTPASSILDLGRAILHAQDRPTTEDAMNVKSDRIFARAFAL